MKTGCFITFEGIDGSGKTTQIYRLKDMLVENGFDPLIIREPGGTVIGEKIRDILLNKDLDQLVPTAELLLYEAARAQIVNEKIKPALLNQKIVICDRFFDSSLAYQGYARGLNLEQIKNLNLFATGGLEPDLTFYLDLTTEEAYQRLDLRLDQMDRLELEGKLFLEKVRQGYLAISQSYDRIISLNANVSEGKLAQKIKEKVLEVLK